MLKFSISISLIAFIMLGGCSKNPNEDKYYPLGQQYCGFRKLYCPTAETEYIKNKIADCTQIVVPAQPNGGEYEDWDTSDYRSNVYACKIAILSSVCVCN